MSRAAHTHGATARWRRRRAVAPGYALLATLVTRHGEVITRAQLLREIWGYSSDVLSRTVDMHIMELRRKLEVDPAKPRHFHTVRKTGYRFTRE